MKRNILNEYIAFNVFNIENNLKLFGKEKSEDALHDLRVSIKKIRAILSFLNKTFKEVDIPKSTDLKKVFLVSGKIREIQLNIKNLLKLPKPPMKLLLRMRKIEQNLTAQFLIDIPHYLNAVEIFDHGLIIPNQLPKKKIIINYFDRITDKSEGLLKKNCNKSDIHGLRKNIKKMMYVYDALPKKNKKYLDLDEKYIDELQDYAGNWHDSFVSLQYFKDCKELKKSQINELKKFEKKQFRLLMKILDSFKKDITK